jgi:hypothetical protein
MASESLVTLAWVADLGLELPAIDQLGDPRDLLDRLPSPWEPVQSFIAGLRLRPEDEIATERERAELWLWRAMIEPERREAKGQSLTEIEAVIKDTAHESKMAGLVDNVRAGDFTLGDQPFRQRSTDQQDLIGIIAAARLHALNWVCGFGASWDVVPFDV